MSALHSARYRCLSNKRRASFFIVGAFVVLSACLFGCESMSGSYVGNWNPTHEISTFGYLASIDLSAHTFVLEDVSGAAVRDGRDVDGSVTFLCTDSDSLERLEAEVPIGSPLIVTHARGEGAPSDVEPLVCENWQLPDWFVN